MDEEYKNKFWSQYHKRKGVEKGVSGLKNEVNELLKRLHLLEVKEVEGKIVKMNSVFYFVTCEFGVFTVHRSQLQNLQFIPANINKDCVFNLNYKDHKYQGVNLYIKYGLDNL